MAGSTPLHRTSTSVDEFIAATDPDGSLATLDGVITAALPGASRVLLQVASAAIDDEVLGDMVGHAGRVAEWT